MLKTARSQTPDKKLLLHHMSEWPEHAETCHGRGWLARGAARAASAAHWKPPRQAHNARGTVFCAKPARLAEEIDFRM